MNIKQLKYNWHTRQLWLFLASADTRVDQWSLNGIQPPGENQLPFQMNWLVNQRAPISCYILISAAKFSWPLPPSLLIESFFLFSLYLIRPSNHSRCSLMIKKDSDLHLVGTHIEFLVSISLGVLYGLVFEDNWPNKDTHLKEPRVTPEQNYLLLKRNLPIIQALFSDIKFSALFLSFGVRKQVTSHRETSAVAFCNRLRRLEWWPQWLQKKKPEDPSCRLSSAASS